MILMVIVFGVLDLARIFNALVVLSNASREAARFGSRFPDDAPGMQQAAVDEAQSAGMIINTTDVSIFCTDTDSPPNGCDRGLPVVVTVTHNFNFILGQLFSANPLLLSRQAQMMVP
jgi:Flp pilus assembly protein TadG